MFVILYTPKTNIDPETRQPVDLSLVQTARAADDAEIQIILGDANELVSKWDADEYDAMFVRMKQAQIDEINRAFESAMDTLVAGYPEREISSWPQQEKEARAYLADNTAATPLLDALSTARGIDKAVLAQKIAEKADAYAAAAGALIGKRQALEDKVNAATTAEEVNAISW